MAHLPFDTPAAPILLLRRVTLGDLRYRVIDSSGIVVDGTDPNTTGNTTPRPPAAVGYLWPRGDGTPSAT